MKRLIKPDFTKSNLNISATLAQFLGAPNKNTTLPILEEELKKGYKNIVFICCDGMGIHPLKKHLDKNSFLRSHIKQTLLSTFPSTTTNATTALACNLLPREHGWLGWSLNFEDVGRNIDIYLHRDSQSGEYIDYKYPIVDNSNCYFDNASTEYKITPVLPECVQTKSKNKIVAEDISQVCNAVKAICKRKGKQFVYSYLTEPDSTMHEYGVSSNQAKQKIQLFNDSLQLLSKEVKNTLFVITADHGHIDIDGYIEFYKDKELNDMLRYVPYLDGRTPAFKVKKGKKKAFETLFKQKYGEDFKLYKTQDLLKKGYFGDRGEYGYLLGDFIGVGTYTHKLFLAHSHAPRFKGHHTSLTEEMEVPLIMIKA